MFLVSQMMFHWVVIRRDRRKQLLRLICSPHRRVRASRRSPSATAGEQRGKLARPARPKVRAGYLLQTVSRDAGTRRSRTGQSSQRSQGTLVSPVEMTLNESHPRACPIGMKNTSVFVKRTVTQTATAESMLVLLHSALLPQLECPWRRLRLFLYPGRCHQPKSTCIQSSCGKTHVHALKIGRPCQVVDCSCLLASRRSGRNQTQNFVGTISAINGK